MIAPQSNNEIGKYRGSGWHGDGWIKPLACLQHAKAENQEFAHGRHHDLLGLEATGALLRRATRAATAGLKRIVDSAGM